ncbi:MAG: RNase adapter RapZ, partial [Burkholderiales bacterium]|nr:RNase adapter RapZ [Burkholderiales bacterium]
MQVIVVTGLSGSGKSIALKQLEDSGFYCIDNLPPSYLSSVTRHLQTVGREHVAVSLDSRSDMTFKEVADCFEELSKSGIDVRVLYLTASTEALVQRYSETRRQHPLSLKSNAPATLTGAIEKEREMLSPFLPHSHLIDTTGMRPSTLQHWVRKFASAKQDSLILTFESFGFKEGIPLASDLVFDVRCLPNPFWEKSLRSFTGRDKPVMDFLKGYPEVGEMIDDIDNFVQKWLPKYREQNRHYLTVSIGCTGGQHRSEYVAEALATRFSERTEGVILR